MWQRLSVVLIALVAIAAFTSFVVKMFDVIHHQTPFF
jgi:hypothetical protein